jgi:hypothetical protein
MLIFNLFLKLITNQFYTFCFDEGGEILTHDAAAPEVPAAEAPASTEQPAQPEFDPNQWALNFKGQPVIPRDRQHLINLAQKGHSFEQRMEDLNKQQKDIEGLKSKYSQYEPLDQLFRENPQFASEIMHLRQKYEGGVQQPTGEAPAQAQSHVPPQVLQEIEQLKGNYQKLISENEDYKLNQEINALKSQYKDHDWDSDDGTGTLEQRLLKHAMDNKLGSIRSAYRDYFFDQYAAQAQNSAIAQNAEKQKELNKAGIVQTGTPAPEAKSTFDHKKASYDDIKAEALNRL